MTGSFIHPTRRYRLYFDETGTGDLKAHRRDQNQRYLSLTGLVFRQDVHDTTFTARLAAFKRRIFQTPDIILHRRDIMDRKGIFALLNDEVVRADFDAQFGDLVQYLPGPAFTISIDKQAHLEKYKVWQFDPYHYVLTCLVERFVMWLGRSGFVGDVMGEARGPKHDGRLRRAFRRLFVNGSSFLDRQTADLERITPRAEDGKRGRIAGGRPSGSSCAQNVQAYEAWSAHTQ
jgi:hypothetical protein